jgi:hypothetical protein
MSREASKGERARRTRATEEGAAAPERGGAAEARPASADTEPAVRERLEKIRRAKHSDMRWGLSRHTAERALVAITDVMPRPSYRPSGKSRRRKRRKRLL